MLDCADLEHALDRARIVFAFSGHGSQTYHMGRSLYEHNPTFRKSMLSLDAAVLACSGRSVLERLYCDEYDRGEVFDDIRFTHPAIFMVEYSMAQVLLAQGIEPHAVIGASLGEYCAATLAGLMSLDQALESTVAQADIYYRRCLPGGMLAILGPTELHGREALLREHTEIASYNYDSNFVVAGRPQVLDRAQARLQEDGTLSQRLPVRLAFHSALMEAAREEVCKQTAPLAGGPARLPFVSCVTSSMLSATNDAYFWDLVRKPIQVARSVEYLERRGSHLYIDLGPSGTFANLIKHNPARHPGSRAYPLLSPFGRDIEALDRLPAAIAEFFRSRQLS